MNWLTNFVRPKIKQLVKQKDIPENLWEKCPFCNNMVYHKDMEKNHHVCNHCGHHMYLTPEKRFKMLFDDGKFTTIEIPEVPHDPLKFKDIKKYVDRLKEYYKKTGFKDANLVAYGTMDGNPVVMVVFDFRFMGGSMGAAVGEAIVSAAELAILQDAALVIVPSSGGARMQEGMLSLMQMARTTVAVSRVKEKGLPYIVVMANPTTGGVTASFAMLGDIHIAEQGAIIGFAGARVIEQTIREKLPEGFQRSEYLLDHGMVDQVVHRKDLRSTLARIISVLRHPKPLGEVLEIDREEILSRYIREMYGKKKPEVNASKSDKKK